MNENNELKTVDVVAEVLGNKKIDVPFIKDVETEEYIYFKIGSMPVSFSRQHRLKIAEISKSKDELIKDIEMFDLARLTVIKTVEHYNKKTYKADEFQEYLNNTSEALIVYYYTLINKAHTAITNLIAIDSEVEEKKKVMLELLEEMTKSLKEEQQD